MKIKLLGILFCLGVFCFGASAQETYGGRELDGIKGDYKSVPIVARVRIEKITLAAKGAHSLYAVSSNLLEVFKGKIKKGPNFTFYFDAEEDYNAQQLVGKEWVVFLEAEHPVPNGGKGWYELENSTVPSSEKLSVQLRKLKGAKNR